MTYSVGKSVQLNLTNGLPTSHILTYTATDQHGIDDKCIVEITIIDDEKPVLTCPASFTVTTDAGLSTTTATWASVNVTDNSMLDIVPVSDVMSGSAFGFGDTVVQFNATDVSGNTGTCTFTVTVQDFFAGTCPPPEAMIEPSGDAVIEAAIPSDGNTVVITWSDFTHIQEILVSVYVCQGIPAMYNVNCNRGSSYPLTSSFPEYNGTILVSYGAISVMEEIFSCRFFLRVIDNERPSIECPSNHSVATDANVAYKQVTLPPPTSASDNSGSLTITIDYGGMTYSVGQSVQLNLTRGLPTPHLLTYTAGDQYGNYAPCIVEITIIDDEKPVLTCPAYFTVTTEVGLLTATATWTTVNVTDNSMLDIVPVSDVTSGSVFEIGDTVVQFNATDVSGNMGTCTFTVTVQDIDDCATVPCLNNGTCTGDINGFICDCVMGFEGNDCSINIDDCATVPCMNGGTCSDDINGFTCDCVMGFEGNDCSISVDECLMSPCPSDAVCVDQYIGFTCLCMEGYSWNTTHCIGSCVEASRSTIFGTITFPAGALGSFTESNPDPLCPDYTINAGQTIAHAVCVGDGFSVAYWDFEIKCGRNLTVDERLALLNQVTVTEENVMAVASQVVTVTEDVTTLTVDGLSSTADIMEKVAYVNSSSAEVSVNVVQVVGNVIDADDKSLRVAEAVSRAPSRIVKVLENQLQNLPIAGDERFREIHPNIAVDVRSVQKSSLLNGLGFTSANSSSEEFGESSLIVMDSDEINQGNEESEIPNAILMLPPEVDILAPGDANEEVRVSFSIFRKGSLFQSVRLAALNKGEDRYNRTINTRVMSATVGNQPIRNLNKPVTILLSRIDNESYVDNTSCVFWDFEEGDWSTEGCRLRENYGRDQYIVCQCDHLTNFAALMDIYPESPLTETQEFILKLLSLVGCGVSILGLTATIVTYLTYRKLRSKRPNQILVNLCSSLLGLYITFVVATALDSQRGIAELDVVPCSILAGFLHYFTLTSLCWMGVEGYNLYLLFVKVVNVYIPKFIWKATLTAWGIPFLIVVITASTTRIDYVQTDFCFLKQIPMIAGLLAPIGIILLFNIFIFSLVVRQFIRTTSADGIQRSSNRSMSKRKQHKQRLQNALTVLTLMGLTWSIGYLNLVQVISFPVQLVFCLLNTLQGYFIFMLYGVRQAEVRKHWRHCCIGMIKREQFSSVQTSSENQTSSNRPLFRAPFNPDNVPKPTSQIYRQRPPSTMPSM